VKSQDTVDKTMPIGVATPGMVVPVPQPQPGELGARSVKRNLSSRLRLMS